MTPYEKWFTNKFGWGPYETYNNIRAVDELVESRRYLRENGATEHSKKFEILTEEEWRQSKGLTQEQVKLMMRGTV